MRTIPRGPRAFPARGSPAQSRVGVQFGSHFESRRGEFAGRSPPHGRYEARRHGCSFESLRHYGPCFPPRGAHSPPTRLERTPPFRSERIPPLRRESFGRSGLIGCDFANPTFEQMARHWFDSFCANPVSSRLLTLVLSFDDCRWEVWRTFGRSTLVVLDT